MTSKKRQRQSTTLTVRQRPDYQGKWVRRKDYEAAIIAGVVPFVADRFGVTWSDEMPPRMAGRFSYPREMTQEDNCDCCGANLLVDSMGLFYKLTCFCYHPYSVCNDCLKCLAHHGSDHKLANSAVDKYGGKLLDEIRKQLQVGRGPLIPKVCI